MAGSPNNVVDLELLDRVPGCDRLFTFLNTNAIENYIRVAKKGDSDLAFNLYFAGTQNKETEQFLMDTRVNRLFSQLNDRSSIQQWVNMIRQEHANARLFIDSGAYTAHTLGRKIDCDEYIDYLNRLDPWLTCFAQLDCIPGVFGRERTAEESAMAPKKSWDNYQYMVKHVKSPEKLIPVFHQGEDFVWLRTMLRAGVEYIGLSCRKDIDSKYWEPFFSECFKVIKEEGREGVKTHAFGLTTFRMLEAFPFYSSDSTTWLQSASNGTILTKFGILQCSDRRINDPAHINHLPPKAREELEEYVKGMGFTLESLVTRYQDRMTFNAKYMYDWAQNYEFKGGLHARKKLF